MKLISDLSPDEIKQEYELIREQLKQKNIPDLYHKSFISSIFAIKFKFRIIELIGFTLISNSWIKLLSKWIANRKCLEVMSGCGSLTYALRKHGIDVIPTDDFTWKDCIKFSDWCDIENIDAVKAVEKYGKEVDIIIMSWAEMKSTAYRVLLKMREVNPNCIMIYIGDSGCTADSQFFNTITEIEDESFSKAVSKFQQWIGIQDYPHLVK